MPNMTTQKHFCDCLHQCKSAKWVSSSTFFFPAQTISCFCTISWFSAVCGPSCTTFESYCLIRRGHDTEPRILMDSIRSPGKLLKLYQESCWSPSGVHQESSWSPSGLSQCSSWCKLSKNPGGLQIDS